MPGTRDHVPVVIEQFNGLWTRGDAESAPSDHFTQADNIQYFTSGFETRDQIMPFANGIIGDMKVKRMYNYVVSEGNVGATLLVLFDNGSIWHVIDPSLSPTTLFNILSIPTMEDFGFVSIQGRAYITPFSTLTDARGVKYQLGLPGESVYVYKGDGLPARKTGGPKPTNPGVPMVAVNGAAGLTDIGFHLFAVVYETDTGYLTALGPEVFASLTMPGTNQVNLSAIPVGPPGFGIVKRHIVATKKILGYNNDQDGYQFFFVPGGNIENNIDTTKTIEFFDIDLIDDASHLIDNFITIPAGVALNTYHDRLVVVGERGTLESLDGRSPLLFDNRNIVRVSHPGEPEAISKIDGLLVVPADGNPLTNVQEFRDILYVFRKMRTFAYSDNFDEPATWRAQVLDQALGTTVHGIATVHDSGGVNIDFLLIANLSGVFLFNGIFVRPEMSWKIENFWFSLSQNYLYRIQIVNNALDKKIWIVLPNSDDYSQIVLHADYADGLDAKNIKWSKWIFYVKMSTITLQQKETDILYFGAFSNGTNPIPPGIDPTHMMQGIYYLLRAAGSPPIPNDLYLRLGPGSPPDPFTTVALKIPDPTIRTALFGE